MNKFYVYLISRTDGRPCYVGKGSGRRLSFHSWAAKNGCHPNHHLASIIRNAGGSLPIVKLRDNLTEIEAFAAEREIIASIGREPNGPLVNKTDGGEGPSGMSHSDVNRELFRKLHTGNKYCVGHKASPESRAKMRAAKLGSTQSPETIEKRFGHRRGEKRPKEWGQRIADAQRQRWAEGKRSRVVSEETKAKMRASHLARRLNNTRGGE